MSIKTDGGDSSGSSTDEVVEILTDDFEDVLSSATVDAFVGGFAVALVLLLPPGQREIALTFAALAGVELSDTHGRKRVPIDVVREGKGGVAGFVVGAVGVGALRVSGYL